jgi:Predicted pyrophosphatase
MKDADVLAQFAGDLTNGGDACGVLAVIAVRKIQSKGGGTSLDQLADPLRAFGGGADGGHDLGTACQIDEGHQRRQSHCGIYPPGLSGSVASDAFRRSGPHGDVVFMDLNSYQQSARTTARYPDVGANPIYPTLGLSGEAGEVADKVKKVLRDRGGVFDATVREELKLELGDVLWYVAQLASELGLSLEEVAEANLAKLASRAARGRLSGSGDHR